MLFIFDAEQSIIVCVRPMNFCMLAGIHMRIYKPHTEYQSDAHNKRIAKKYEQKYIWPINGEVTYKKKMQTHFCVHMNS